MESTKSEKNPNVWFYDVCKYANKPKVAECPTGVLTPEQILYLAAWQHIKMMDPKSFYRFQVRSDKGVTELICVSNLGQSYHFFYSEVPEEAEIAATRMYEKFCANMPVVDLLLKKKEKPNNGYG